MSDKVRVYEIAEEAGVSSADVIAKAKDLGFDKLKSPQSAVSYEDAEEITNYIMTGKSSRLPNKTVSKPKKVVEKKTTEITEEIKETNVQLEKIEVVEIKESTVVKKPELKKVIISKPIPKAAPKTQEEFDKPEVNPDNASKIVPKRRGLVIVKKNKPREDEEVIVTKSFDSSEAQPRKQMKSLSEILGANEDDDKSSNENYNSAEEQRKNKAKKEKKKSKINKEEISSNEEQIKSSNKDSNDYKEEKELKNNETKELFSSEEISYKFKYKNILFKGVPGTGKSRTIDKIIENNLNLQKYSENILRINIHSSSSNSDLMQGIGINSDEGAIQYKEKQGLILNFIQKATFCPLQPFALILEEIQENSLNELIGDLIYLIEDSKRTKIVSADDVKYTYEELIEKFKKDKVEINSVKIPNLVSQNNIYKTMILPNNLFIFCTSNYRDDKKVIEDNLLRRFDVIEIYPKYKKELGDDFINQIISNFLENLNESILNFCSEKGEIHPDRFMIGHSIWLKVDNKQDFERTFLKVITEFKDVKDFHFDDFKEIIKEIEFPFDIEKDYATYQAWINNLQKNCYDFLEYK